MKEPFDYKQFTIKEKQEFVILNYKGYSIELNKAEDWYTYTGGGCSAKMHDGLVKTYSHIVKSMIYTHPNLVKYRVSENWEKIIPVIKKLRQEKCYKEAFKNQLKQIDHYLNYLDLEATVKYVVGAINVLNGKKGAYPI